MSMDKIYELKRDIWTPSDFIRAGTRKTETHWKERLGDFEMTFESDWFIDLEEQEKIDRQIDELDILIKTIFSKQGLNSISYKEATREIAESWLKQNK